MNEQHSMSFQFGLLDFVHVLMMEDGSIDEREIAYLKCIKEEEKITNEVFQQYEESRKHKTVRDIYLEGIELLSQCEEEEKLNAFVHLYRLMESDSQIHVREVRFLLYSLKQSKLEFEDVEMSVRMSKAQPSETSKPASASAEYTNLLQHLSVCEEVYLNHERDAEKGFLKAG